MKAPGAAALVDLRWAGRHGQAQVVHSWRRWGTPRRIPGFQDLVFVPQPLRLPTHSQEVNTAVRLGASRAARPLELAMPILLAIGDSWMLSKPARIALAQASRLAGIAVHTHEMLPEERLAAKSLVLQVFHKNIHTTGHILRHAEALELHFDDQEDRMGCHLETDKNNQGISPNHTCESDMLPEGDLTGIIVKCRMATDQQAPIIFSLNMGRVPEDIRFAVKVKADIVRMKGLADIPDCLDIVSAPLGIPTIGGLAAAHRTLAENGWENRLDLVVSGGIGDGADVAKALALGAKAVAVSRGALLALGCTSCGSCKSGRCLQGIATQDPNLMKKLNIDTGAQRVYSYLTTLKEEVQQICAVMGKSDVAELGAEDVQATTMEASAMTGLPLVGTGRVF
jgi:hypothetical protein